MVFFKKRTKKKKDSSGVLLLVSRVPLALAAATRWRAIAVGVLIAVQSYCLYSAVAAHPVALALLAFNTFPMMFTLLSWAAGSERPARRALIAMPSRYAGSRLRSMCPARAAASPAARSEIGAGVGFALGAAVSFANGAVFHRALAEGRGRQAGARLLTIEHGRGADAGGRRSCGKSGAALEPRRNGWGSVC